MQGWGGSYRGGVGHAGVGGSCWGVVVWGWGGACRCRVGWVMQGWGQLGHTEVGLVGHEKY